MKYEFPAKPPYECAQCQRFPLWQARYVEDGQVICSRSCRRVWRRRYAAREA